MGSLINPSMADSISIGGRTILNPNSKIWLYGKQGTNAGCTFRALGASSGYQVTAGKTLRVLALIGISNSATGTIGMLLAQSDNDIGLDSATALTNPVYISGSAGNFWFQQDLTGDPSRIEMPCNFTVAATKYLSMILGTIGQSQSFTLVCEEF